MMADSGAMPAKLEGHKEADEAPKNIGDPACPTFSEVWFDDPAEGEAAQRAALELKHRIEIRATTIRQYLESTVVPLLLQGLQHLVLERPTNPVEYLAAFLLKNNPHPPPPPDVGKEASISSDANGQHVAQTKGDTIEDNLTQKP